MPARLASLYRDEDKGAKRYCASTRFVLGMPRAGLAGYKKPRHVEFADSLPRNSLGKVC